MKTTLIFNQTSQQHRDIDVTPEQWNKAVKGHEGLQKFICKRFRKAAGCGFVDFAKLELGKTQPKPKKPEPATLF